MSEEQVNEVAPEGVDPNAPQFLSAAQLMLVVQGGNVVSCELIWNDKTVHHPQHAAMAMATLQGAMLDTRWTLRQCMRVSPKETPN